MPLPQDLLDAIHFLPAGRYAVGVSGGADSVALLHLLHHHRPDLCLHIVHLDHQTRGEASTGDAAFVGDLAARWNLPLTLARRDQLEPQLPHPPRNPSALYRALRQALYRRTIHDENLSAVLLAHHAGDQAETVLHHLLRGTGPTGMPCESRLPGLRILRPLLAVPGPSLRQYLASVNQPWREDASNQSPKYLRNRLRRLLAAHPALAPALLDLEHAFHAWRDWLHSAAPDLPPAFPITAIRGLPEILAAEAARCWLLRAGVPAPELTAATIGRLLAMAADAASPPRQHFPGKILVRRRQGAISAGPG